MRWLNKFMLPIIILIVFISAKNIQWGEKQWKDILEADGKGYYAYLPATFIYKDLNFGFFDSIEKKHPNPAIFYDYRSSCEGKTCNKYFAGTALAISPFFLIAHLSSTVLDLENDGYSKLYMIMINVAAIFYLWLGLFFLKKILQRYTSNPSLVSALILLIVFSTNLFYYTVCEPSMSHIYSFGFITAFVYYSKKYFDEPNCKSVLLMAILFGLIVFIRPVNGIVVLVLPFIAGEWRVFKNGMNFLFSRYGLLFNAFLLASAIVSIQFIIYKIQTGHFFIDTYGAEAFNWLSPHPFGFLFSYKKGLFVYTPILFLSLLGLFFLYKQNRFRFYAFILFGFLLVYVLSSWWNWWYGGSFGTRVMLEYYSIFVLLLLIAIENLKTKIARIVFSTLLVGTLLVCQIQTYQYRYYHIHWEKMDKEHYWKSFLRIDLVAKNQNPNKDLLQN